MKCFDGTVELGVVLYGIFKGGGRDALVVRRCGEEIGERDG